MMGACPVLYWSVKIRDGIAALEISKDSNPTEAKSVCLPLHHLITYGYRLMAVVDLPELVLQSLAPGETS